jgi:hypothetical protein
MSVIKETIGELALKKVPARLALYEQLVENAESLFKLEGKSLEEACKEHAQNLMMYDLMLQECKTIEETIKVKTEEIESNLYRKYNESYQRALGTTEIKQYIKGDPSYISAYEILLEVNHIKRKLESVVEALKSMGWSLSHIVKLRVAQLGDDTL